MDMQQAASYRGVTTYDHVLLTQQIEEFLYKEADTIDSRHFEEWLAFFTEDIRYWVPIRKNLAFDSRFDDATDEHENAWIDDNRMTLHARVYQVMTKLHWAEEPLSRVSHFVSNVYIERIEQGEQGEEITVRCKLLVHRSRMEEAGEILIGKREDRIRKTTEGFKICWRKILIDQATLSTKNLSFFL